MKAWIVGLVAGLALSAQAAEPESVTAWLTWKLSLDATGRITHLSTDDKRAPLLHARLADAIRGWKFSPGHADGEPAATETWLNTQIEVSVIDDAAKVRWLSADTGGKYLYIKPPRYPDRAVKSRTQGVVVLLVNYDETGTVRSLEPYEHASTPDRALVNAALAAVRKWKFAPETVAGKGVAAAAVVPVCFALSARYACKWKNESSDERSDGNSLVAMNPAATLHTDVVGSLL